MKDIRKIIYAIMLTIISVCGLAFIILEKLEVEEQGLINYNEIIKEDEKEEEGEIQQVQEIYVQISGAVKNPNVYCVVEGTRVFELLELAGGLLPEADTVSVNQAREIKDEENIYFPTKEEVLSGKYSVEGSSTYININNASIDQLTSLTGIGEAKAKSIISYREKNGDFEKIEDIMEVPGIKESLFEIIKDKITV